MRPPPPPAQPFALPATPRSCRPASRSPSGSANRGYCAVSGRCSAMCRSRRAVQPRSQIKLF